MSADEEDDDFAPQIMIGLQTVSAEAPDRRFAAWHKPRKQWIRDFQWRDEVAKLMDEKSFRAEQIALHYLGLPGEDMLDVRILHELCSNASKELRYVGFVAAKGRDRIQLNESDASLKRHPTINPHSRIVENRIEALALKNSPEHSQFKEASPYHVVNIDLTDHLTRRPAEGESYILALANIIDEQIRKAYTPWLLFLTTRISAEGVHERNLRGFIEAVARNARSSSVFAEGARTLLCAEACDLMSLLSSPQEFSATAFRDFFCLGFGKWLLSLITSGVPPQHAKMLRSCHYSVSGEIPDMLSLGFKVTPQRRGTSDDFGLLGTFQEAPEASEVDLGLQMLTETRNLIDLDRLLIQNPDLYEQMVVESIATLKEANYMRGDENGTLYRTWLSQGA